MQREVNRMKMDSALFLMDHKRLDFKWTVTVLPKSLSIIDQQRLSAGYWRSPSSLELGLMCVGRISQDGQIGYPRSGNCLHLQHIVKKRTRGDLQDAWALASFLGVRSSRFQEDPRGLLHKPSAFRDA